MDPQPSTSRRRSPGHRVSDEEILVWQETQLSRSNVDNTVNRLIESCSTLFQQDRPASNRGFEESAILMAINEYGLHQALTVPPPAPAEIPQIPISPAYLQRIGLRKTGPTTNRVPSDIASYDEDTISSTLSSRSMEFIVSELDAQSDSDCESEHSNFLEAAVTVAISKKGLTPNTIQMSPNR